MNISIFFLCLSLSVFPSSPPYEIFFTIMSSVISPSVPVWFSRALAYVNFKLFPQYKPTIFFSYVFLSSYDTGVSFRFCCFHHLLYVTKNIYFISHIYLRVGRCTPSCFLHIQHSNSSHTRALRPSTTSVPCFISLWTRHQYSDHWTRPHSRTLLQQQGTRISTMHQRHRGWYLYVHVLLALSFILHN